MSSEREIDQPEPRRNERQSFVQMRTFINANGCEMVALRSDNGEVTMFLNAELNLMTWGDRPRPPGHAIRFKDGNQRNLELSNLEWVPSETIGSDQFVRS
jgi:hypothetical protein